MDIGPYQSISGASGPLNGWIILDKPLGLGSTAGVSAVKRALREGGYPKVKVGHGGTLDPLATGVLPIALGEATKLAGRMLDSDKVYDFTIQFGTETDGLDAEGLIVAESDIRPSVAQIEAVLAQFIGNISQIPPAYSAIKIDGKRAYDRARAGEMVEMAARNVTIHDLRFVRSFGPDETYSDAVTLRAHVSKGTYIRSLARDVAAALGTVGHVTWLHRLRAGPFTLENAISLDILFETAKRAALEDILLPIRTALDDIPALALSPEQARLLHHGQVLTGIAATDGLTLALDGETPLALVEVSGGNVRVVRRFNL